MDELAIKTDAAFTKKFESYSPDVRKKMQHLRNIVHQTAKKMDTLSEIEETLKWGEPSYVTKHGSTLRMDWKERSPDTYAVYFKCTSKLVPTFKRVFGDVFDYEKDRAIVFNINDAIPEKELSQCIAATLNYHSVKDLPNLGIET